MDSSANLLVSATDDLGGEALHLFALGAGLEEDEGTAGGFKVLEALADGGGGADEAGAEASVGDGVVAEAELGFEFGAGDELLDSWRSRGRTAGRR